MRVSTAAILFLTHFKIAASALACTAILEDNAQVAKQIEAVNGMVAQYRSQLKKTETHCKAMGTEVVTMSSKAASGEICSALEDIANMSSKITVQSVDCNHRIEEINKKFAKVYEERIKPMEDDLEKTVKLDKSLPSLQQVCARELAQTRELQKRSKQLAEQSLDSMASAGFAWTNYHDMGEQAEQHRETAMGSFERCGLSKGEAGQIILANGKNESAHLKNAKKETEAEFRGQSFAQNASTVTGKIHNDSLDSSSSANAGGLARMPAISGISESSGKSPAAERYPASIKQASASENIQAGGRDLLGQFLAEAQSSQAAEIGAEAIEKNSRAALTPEPQAKVATAVPTQVMVGESPAGRAPASVVQDSAVSNLPLRPSDSGVVANQEQAKDEGGETRSSASVVAFVPSREEIAAANSGVPSEMSLFIRVHNRLVLRLAPLTASAGF